MPKRKAGTSEEANNAKRAKRDKRDYSPVREAEKPRDEAEAREVLAANNVILREELRVEIPERGRAAVLHVCSAGMHRCGLVLSSSPAQARPRFLRSSRSPPSLSCCRSQGALRVAKKKAALLPPKLRARVIFLGVHGALTGNDGNGVRTFCRARLVVKGCVWGKEREEACTRRSSTSTPPPTRPLRACSTTATPRSRRCLFCLPPAVRCAPLTTATHHLRRTTRSTTPRRTPSPQALWYLPLPSFSATRAPSMFPPCFPPPGLLQAEAMVQVCGGRPPWRVGTKAAMDHRGVQSVRALHAREYDRCPPPLHRQPFPCPSRVRFPPNDASSRTRTQAHAPPHGVVVRRKRLHPAPGHHAPRLRVRTKRPPRARRAPREGD